MSLVDDLVAEIKRAKALNLAFDSQEASVANFKHSRNSAILNSIKVLLEKIERLNPEAGLIISKIRTTTDFDVMLNFAYKLPLVEDQRKKIFTPGIVSDEINADWKEANDCFEQGLHRSCVILCGRILEIALHAKYYQVTNIDLLEKAPGVGLGNLIAKLSDKGALVDPGLSNQIHLINQVRIHSVHKKTVPFLPTKYQAKAIMLYTKDAVEKLFAK